MQLVNTQAGWTVYLHPIYVIDRFLKGGNVAQAQNRKNCAANVSASYCYKRLIKTKVCNLRNTCVATVA